MILKIPKEIVNELKVQLDNKKNYKQSNVRMVIKLLRLQDAKQTKSKLALLQYYHSVLLANFTIIHRGF